MERAIIVGSLHEAGVQQEFLEAVSALRNLNKEIEVTAVFCDQQLTQNVKEQLEINGIHRVLFYKRTENPISFQQLAKQWYKHFSSEHLDVIVFTESSWTTQLASRLAVHYDTKAIFDVVALSLPEQGMYVFERRLPGQRIQAVEISDTTTICSFEAHAFTKEKNHVETRSMLEVIEHEVADIQVDFYKQKEVVQPFVQLKDADVIVAGGRGVHTKEAYDLLEDLARCFPNSAIGASGGALETGFFSEDLLIGQTGTKIRPRLYFACGISGANQHTGGTMKAETIIAINEDPNAHIFEICDYGIVGNVEEVLPKLIREISLRQSSTESLFI